MKRNATQAELRWRRRRPLLPEEEEIGDADDDDDIDDLLPADLWYRGQTGVGLRRAPGGKKAV